MMVDIGQLNHGTLSLCSFQGSHSPYVSFNATPATSQEKKTDTVLIVRELAFTPAAANSEPYVVSVMCRITSPFAAKRLSWKVESEPFTQVNRRN